LTPVWIGFKGGKDLVGDALSCGRGAVRLLFPRSLLRNGGLAQGLAGMFAMASVERGGGWSIVS